MSLSQMCVLGIDVTKAKLDIALLLPDGKFRSEVIPNTPEGFEKLATWLDRNGTAQVHACMERSCRQRNKSGPVLRERNSAPLSPAATRWSA